MRVVHETPHKDLAFFARAPLRLTAPGGREVVIEEWCLAGVRKPDGIDVLPKRGCLHIPFQGVDLSFPLRLSPDSSGGFYAFEGLTVRQRETLALFHTNLLSGRMAATGEMITALDTPVDLVPMGETEEEEAQGTAGAPSRSWRVAKALATYVAIALLVFGLLGQSIAMRLMTIPAVQARVVAPVVEHLATAPAYVDRILVNEGQQVEAGETLIRMSDPRRDGRLDEARREVAKRQAALTDARDLLRKHDAAAPLQRQELEDALNAALAQQGIAPKAENDARIEATLAALIEFDAHEQNGAADWDALRAELVRQRDLRKDELRLAKRAQGIAKADARLLDIKAQVAGTVNMVNAPLNSHVSRGTFLVSVEENAPRVLRAWVDEAHLTRVSPGMTARLRASALDGPQELQGTVTTVAAGIDESAARQGFGLIVTVEVSGDRQLLDGQPVQMRLWRSWVPDWARW